MEISIPIRILILAGVAMLCGCDLFRNSETIQQTAKPDSPIELSPEHNEAFVDAMRPAIAPAVANVANEFGGRMFEGLEIADEIESSLINPGLNGLQDAEDAITTVYLFRRIPNDPKTKTIVLSVDNRIVLRLVRIPANTESPYAVIHHNSHSLSLIVERFLVYNQESGWQKQPTELQNRNISLGEEPAG